MSIKAQMVMSEMKPCAFCAWHTHKFPDDEEHERLHNEGWHTCGLDGTFRQFGGDCCMFLPDAGIWASF